MESLKKCTCCGKELPLYEFAPDGRYKYGVLSRCRKCIAKAAREYRLKREKAGWYKSKPPKQKEEDLVAIKEFNIVCGGYKIFVLNHCKEGEVKYTCVKVSTAEVFRTNDKRKFLCYLEGVI